MLHADCAGNARVPAVWSAWPLQVEQWPGQLRLRLRFHRSALDLAQFLRYLALSLRYMKIRSPAIIC